MGALTDNRKRCFVDLCLTLSPHPLSDLSLETPLSKKPKFSSPPSVPNPTALSLQAPTVPDLRRFPPPAPLPRPVHGPQRTLKAFGFGSAVSNRRSPTDWVSRREPETEMGNVLSPFIWAKKRVVSSSVLSQGKAKASVGPSGDERRFDDDRSHEGLGLEEYKKLVVGVTDSPIAAQKAEEPAGVLNRKVEDARKVVVVVESMSVREESVREKKGPLYKELLEALGKYSVKLRSLDFEIKFLEKKRPVFQKKPEEDLRELFVPLSDEEENDVSLALRGGNRREVLAIHEASNIEITREVLQCLTSGAWLNDEVINLYFELLKEREKRHPKRFLKCHFFNTFFYKKLSSGRNGYDFKAVRRWTTQRKIGYGLIECDKIFVPIHKEMHWCLAVINVKDENFQYLDSLGGMDTDVLRVLARYFMEEVKDKSEKQIDTMSWKQEAVNDLPQQKNGWDCGMFMVKYADFYSRGLGLCFGQEHMAYFRKRTVKEILKLRAE